VVLEGAGAGTDCGGEDLLEALGGGYCFYGFEVLISFVRLVLGVRREEKYFYGFDLQLERCILVYYDHGMWM
jgi:hypothetical protein